MNQVKEEDSNKTQEVKIESSKIAPKQKLEELHYAKKRQTENLKDLSYQCNKKQHIYNLRPSDYKADNDQLIPLSELYKAQKNLEKNIPKTPLTYLNNMSIKYECNIYLKREDLQPVRSFKIRGAYNKFLNLTEEEKSRGVVCSSAGNHAQGVAYSCNQMKVKGTIFMPKDAPDIKVNAVKMFGGEWIEARLVGDTFDEAFKAALNFREETNAVFVHAYDDECLIAGAGTTAVEALEDFKGDKIDYFFLPIGGGGIAAGMSSYIKQMSPETQIIGCEPFGCPSMLNSLQNQQKGNVVLGINTFVDGAAVGTPGQIPGRILNQTLRDIVLVPEGQCCTTLIDMFQQEGILCEPAGTLCVAALEYYREEIKGKNILCLVSGSNNDLTRMVDIQNLSEIQQERRYYLLVNFKKRQGALKYFITNILGDSDELLSVEYTNKKSEHNGLSLVGIQCKKAENFKEISRKMQEKQIEFKTITPQDKIYKYLL